MCRLAGEIAMIDGLRVAGLLLAFTASCSFAQETAQPKFGPEATPIFDDNEYLRSAPASDYWTLSAFYMPQQTSSDCSAAAIAMAVNALRGLPDEADEELVTEDNLLETVNDKEWSDKVADEGPGVTFADTQKYLRKSLDGFDLKDATISAVQPATDDAAQLEALETALGRNESSPDNVMLVYFNQGVITGDWDGPHISAIGAYDVARKAVLVMDVDRDWYVPYWTSTKTLLAALVKPISAEHGVLAGGSGGYLLIDSP
jgi:hypothetical protein